MLIALPPELPSLPDRPPLYAPALADSTGEAKTLLLAGNVVVPTIEEPGTPVSPPVQIVSPMVAGDAMQPVEADTSADQTSADQTVDAALQPAMSAEDSPGEEGGIDQVTSVSQLSDVSPTEWAFQALQSLVERYGCIQGYPDKTFRGNQALTRYEFAAGLNACMDRINELIAASTAELVKREDLLALQKLQEEFVAELASLRGQVDGLEVRTATLEKQQFSTTTVLRGQSIFSLATATGGDPPGLGETNPVFTNLTQLQLFSSFYGRDFLRIDLATGNFANAGFANAEALNTNMALLSFQTGLENQINLAGLDYRFAVSDRLVLAVQPIGFSLSSVLSPNSDYTSASTGAISRFAAFSPVFRIGNPDAGAGLDWLLSNRWRLQFAYGVRNGNIPFGPLPEDKGGLFTNDHRVLGVQFLNRPSRSVTLGFAYVNGYSRDGHLDTLTGSNNADISGEFEQRATIHALNLSLRWRIAPKLTLGAWGGAIVALSRQSDAATLTSTYLLSLGLDDPFGREGDQLSVLVGQPPKLNIGYLIERFDEDTSLHIEAFYRFRLNDNISISPGFFYVTDPGHIAENNNIFVGTIRTTFSF
jgi:hypothetical protein